MNETLRYIPSLHKVVKTYSVNLRNRKNMFTLMCIERTVSLNNFLNTCYACNGTPLQYSCLENPMDRGAQQAAVHEVAKSQTQLSDFTLTFHFHTLERKWQPTPVFLPGESQGWGSLVGCHLWGRTESDTTEEAQQQQHACQQEKKNN